MQIIIFLTDDFDAKCFWSKQNIWEKSTVYKKRERRALTAGYHVTVTQFSLKPYIDRLYFL